MNKLTFSLQHYNSWKVKTATGLDMSGLTEAEKEAKKLQIDSI